MLRLAATIALLIVGSATAGGKEGYTTGAIFGQSRPLLKVSIVGRGTVTSRPKGISCPKRCRVNFAPGARVRLTARAAKGWRFARFGGACAGRRPCVVRFRRSAAVRVIFLRKPPPPPPLPSAGTIVARIPVEDEPLGLIYADGAIWVARHRTDSVARVDPATNTVVADVVIPLGSGSQPGRFAAGAEGLWLVSYSDNKSYQIDPTTNRVVAEVAPSGENCCNIAVGAGSVWVMKADAGVVRVDATSHNTLAHISMSFGSEFAFGSLWGNQGSDVVRVGPATNAVTARIPIGDGCCSMKAGAGALWVVAAPLVVRIDPGTNTVAAQVAVPGIPEVVAADDGATWAVGGPPGAKTLWRIDQNTNKVVAALDIGNAAIGDVALGAGSIWISLFDKGQVLRITPAA